MRRLNCRLKLLNALKSTPEIFKPFANLKDEWIRSELLFIYFNYTPVISSFQTARYKRMPPTTSENSLASAYQSASLCQNIANAFRTQTFNLTVETSHGDAAASQPTDIIRVKITRLLSCSRAFIQHGRWSWRVRTVRIQSKGLKMWTAQKNSEKKEARKIN